jgi:hypothetical protein
MSVTSVGSHVSQNPGSLLLQQLVAQGARPQGPSGSQGVLEDLLALSPAAQQLTQAPGTMNQTLSADSKNLLLTALLNGESNASNPAALLSLYGSQGLDPRFAFREA